MSDVPFISPTQQDYLGNEFFRLHATFARDIVIYKTPQQTVILSNPANSYIFDQAPFNDQVNTVPVSGVFKARILYGKKQEEGLFSSPKNDEASDQVNLLKEEGQVRIQVDMTGAAYLFDAKRVTFDGEIFDITASKRPHGLFAPKFCAFYLTKLN
jgi:hypothetical protein